MEVWFEPSAREVLLELRGDPLRRELAIRVDAALRALLANPGDARCRRRSYAPFGWGMPVRTRNDDWLIIWRPESDRALVVRYVGPEP